MTAKKGRTTLVRWNGPEWIHRIIGGYVWESGTAQEIPDDLALELLTLPGDQFEVVNERDMARLLGAGKGGPREGTGIAVQGDKTDYEDMEG